ncbi:hypothetical protein GCM10009860_23440 [Microbacterium mitrae]|uniref:Tetratricopeptide repeat protein n=1 Tax=Microbacterium mitrae TaxID=664640 RepID=A0A5C8HL44_9MICO|nr:hypothetical protein [Microbacterium mitrae]TXK03984.1 hypothetical protein FVP60_09405 [Microbacterium mitrae]
MSDTTGQLDGDETERDRTLAWELYESQPDHPMIEQLALSILSRAPQMTGQIILLSRHYLEVGRTAEARELLRELVSRRDRQYVNALRDLRDLEYDAENKVEAMPLAEQVLREAPGEKWMDLLMLGQIVTFARSRSEGWNLVEQAVAEAAKMSPEDYASAVGLHAAHLLDSGATPEVFLPVAERAIALDPTETILAVTLGFAYLYTYRPEEAETIALRVLREEPTFEAAQVLLKLAQAFLTPIRVSGATMDDLREAGIGEYAWSYLMEHRYDSGVSAALAALDEVMPEQLARTLHPPLTREQARAGAGESSITEWHNGQDAGTGALWGGAHPFRLLADAEIAQLEAAMIADPETEPLWGDDGPSYLAVVASDDAGNYLIVGPGGRLLWRDTEDRVFAPSLATWLWDLAVGLGAHDPRPGAGLH